MPQFNYTHEALMLGQIATTETADISSFVNELLAQETEVSFGGNAVAGVYTLQIDGPDATALQVSVTSAGADTPAQMVAAFVAAIVADSDFNNLLTATDAAPEIELDFIHPGQVYVVSVALEQNAITTVATIQAAGGTDIALGVGVVPGSSADLAIAPSAGSVDADFLGVTIKGTVEISVNDGLSTSESVFAPGCSVSVMEEGACVVMTEDAVAFNGAVFMRIVATGTEVFGAFRSDADGGDAIAITGAKFRSATTGAGLAVLKVNRP